MKIYVDSNIVIDCIAKREPFFRVASMVISAGMRGKIELQTSSLSVNNIMYVLRKEIGKSETKEAMKAFCAFAKITAVDSCIINTALSMDWTDFEDCVQYLSAKSAGADVIVTRNAKDFAGADVRVMMPEEFLDEYYEKLASD